MKNVIKIANAAAFWGDRMEATSELMEQQPDLDYITLDYLSEMSLSIMAVQREKDPQTGYARDFVDVFKSLVPFWKKGSKVKVITNAGGLNPKQCADACLKASFEIPFIKIGIVYGDDVLEQIKSHSSNPLFNNLETKEPVSTVLDHLTTANAYLGAKSIAEALALGADVVITGRVADPSMAVGPCLHHFGWASTDYSKIAQATVAGHLIECGTQVTGGISTAWLEMPEPDRIGFPFVEINREADVVVTKPANTGGKVTVDIVKEQLLYEIGDPGAYLSPDATVSLLSLQLDQTGHDRVSVEGAQGKAPPDTYKVSAAYRDGYRAEGMLAIFGRDCETKARRGGEMIFTRMQQAGLLPQKYRMECLGCGDVVPGIMHNQQPLECMLRICAADPRIEVLEYFAKQIAPLVTCGPAGTTGYTTGRPHIRPVFGYWPCLIETTKVQPKIELWKK
jgi:Acyclic terpene utilisation family protein AtuA